jgi:TetR/AcrR family transcriptional regulator, cholesterol catabolism regulator
LQEHSKTPRLANRRELIIKTAARLFREKGFEGTTVRELADAVDLQSGSLFFHFDSKEEILLAVLEGGLLRAVVILNRWLQKARSPREKLAAIFHGHLKAILEEERDAFTIILRDWRTLSPRSRKAVIALRDKYEEHIDRVLREIAHEPFIPKDIRLFRLFLLGALNWTVQWYRPGGALTVDQLAERFLSMVVADRDVAGKQRLTTKQTRVRAAMRL